jgi:hypothetical protein
MALGVVLVLGAVALRVILGAMVEYHKGDRDSVRRAYDTAMVHYERSIRWYVPGNPYPARSLESLLVLCELRLRDGRPRDAFNCFQRARSAVLSTRSFYTPYADKLARLDERITDLSPGLGYPAARMRADLQRSFEADPWWSLAAVTGLFGWLGGLAWLIWNGVDGQTGRLRWSRRVGLALGLFVVGVGLWLVGLWRA